MFVVRCKSALVSADSLIAAALGFAGGILSALWVTWIQFKFRLKEDAIKRDNDKREREQVEDRRIATERDELIRTLSDLRKTAAIRRAISYIDEQVSDRYYTTGAPLLGDKLAVWWRDDRAAIDALQYMSVDELRLLYTTCISVLGLMAAESATESERSRRLQDLEGLLGDTLRRLHDGRKGTQS